MCDVEFTNIILTNRYNVQERERGDLHNLRAPTPSGRRVEVGVEVVVACLGAVGAEVGVVLVHEARGRVLAVLLTPNEGVGRGQREQL